ncbi:hypothetical protein [Kitasatospora sp. NPDC001225]
MPDYLRSRAEPLGPRGCPRRSCSCSIDHIVPRDQAVRSARLVGKDLDGALDAENRDLGLLGTKVHSVRAVSRLTKLDGYLKPYAAEPAVAEFRERVGALPAMAA